MTIWYDIKKEHPLEGKHVIGIKVYPNNSDVGVICGVLYDLRENSIIDFQRGRWMEITHWAYPPGLEPEEKPKPKYGEPGFQWPACEQCGSTSLRCGCD